MNSTNALHRIESLQTLIPPDEAWLLSNPTDIHYYTQFDCLVTTEREAYLVVTSTQATLIHSAFSPTSTVPSKIERRQGTFVTQLPDHLRELQKHYSFIKLAVDTTNISHHEFLHLEKVAQITLAPLDRSSITYQQAQKDELEQAAITSAISITTQLFKWIHEVLQPGISEEKVASQLYQKMLQLGGDITPAFPFIVAFGEHTALPHHQPTSKVLELETPVLIDMGARYKNYCSDMTRTFWFGEHPSKEFLKVEKTVFAAYTAAEEIVLQTNTTNPPLALDVDSAARNIIAEAGYQKEFIHTTGHGLGLSIHEKPSLSWQNHEPLRPGMAVTVEPGIYLPGKFGYRHENTLLIQRKD